MLAIFLVSCEDDRLDVDVSHIEVEVDIHRFDRQIFDWSALGYRRESPQVSKQYPGFYKHYFEDVIRIGRADDSLLFSSIRLFVNDPSIQQLHAAVQERFPDLDHLEAALENGWKHYKYYFPGRTVPRHIAFIGALSANVMVTDSAVGIGLDAYLGRNHEIYELAQRPLYQRKQMIPEKIAPDVIRGWLETEFVLQNEQPTLLEVIVHQGRLLYALEACFPDMPDSLKIGYTTQEMEWARAFEKNVWTFFIDEQTLFHNDVETVAKYTNDGPFTTGLARESPARMGTYLGWQIVRAYMKHHKEKDLADLMALTDAQEILQHSKYKP